MQSDKYQINGICFIIKDMRPLYASLQDLEMKSQEYFKTYKQRTPRHYRVFLGVSKHLLSTWQNTQPSYFNHIKTMEDLILADIEKAVVYGTAKNIIGKMFVLKAYDHYQYAPELHQIDKQETQTIIIENENKSNKKIAIGVIENEQVKNRTNN